MAYFPVVSGAAHSYVGYNTVGASLENGTAYRVRLKQITLASAGLIASIGAYIRITGNHLHGIAAAVYSDSGGAYKDLLAASPMPGQYDTIFAGPAGTFDARWYHRSVGLYVAAGTYWVAVMQADNNFPTELQWAYDTSGSDHYYTGTDGVP